MQRVILIQKFCTNFNFYIYDPCTNEILKVSKIIYDIIDMYLEHGSHTVLCHFERDYSIESLKAALAFLEQIIEKRRYFFPQKPVQLHFPLTSHEIEKNLDSGIQQIILGITEACNLRCAYCVYSGKYSYQRVHTKRVMAFETAKSAIEYYDRHSRNTESQYITFYGGEPLLAIDIIERVIEYAKDTFSRNYLFNLSTNGTLLKGEIAGFLIENEVALMVSLDGPAKVHNSVRAYPDGTGSFDDIIKNLRYLKEESPDYYKRKVGFRPTISRYDEIESVYKFFSENRDLFEGQYIRVGFVDPFDNSMNDGVISTDGGFAYKKLLAKYKQFKIDGVRAPLFFNEMFEAKLKKIHTREACMIPDSFYPNGICCPGIRKIFCTVDGQYTICERVNPGLIIGDINHGIDVKRVYSLIIQYTKLSEEDCSRCWGVRFCTICFTSIYSNQFNIEKKRQVCNFFLNELRTMMILYCSIRESNYSAFDNVILSHNSVGTLED